MGAKANTAGLANGLADAVNVRLIQLQKVAGVDHLLVESECLGCVVVETKDFFVVRYRQVFIASGSHGRALEGRLHDRVVLLFFVFWFLFKEVIIIIHGLIRFLDFSLGLGWYRYRRLTLESHINGLVWSGLIWSSSPLGIRSVGSG